MKFIKPKNYVTLFFFFTLILTIGCEKKYSPEMQAYVDSILEERKLNDDFMKNDANSPFNKKGKVEFEPLKYFDVDPEFVFKSKLTEFETKDTVIVIGTKGEERKMINYGFVTFDYQNNNYKMNVYKGETKNGDEYYSIWFTDKTTGEETYGVGRYLDFELSDEKNFLYTIDFNKAYNPYCAYSTDYSCAIPTKEDYIDLAVTAGEKNYHK